MTVTLTAISVLGNLWQVYQTKWWDWSIDIPLFDFRCDSGHISEAIRPSDVRHIACPDCDLTAGRMFSSRVAIVGPTTDMRGMFRRYQEASHDMGGAPQSGLWSASKARAQAMTAAGEAPSIRTT